MVNFFINTIQEHFTPHAMDYSFLNDPNAIAEILATAEPEHRAMQSAEGWDDKTLAIKIATKRHNKEAFDSMWKEWKGRVMRMSDEDLEKEDDVIRAMVDPYVKDFQAMSEDDKRQASSSVREKIKWLKEVYAFTKDERVAREDKKKYSKRLQLMSDEGFQKEIQTLDQQLTELNKNIAATPSNADQSVHLGNVYQMKTLEAKSHLVRDERNRRAEK